MLSGGQVSVAYPYEKTWGLYSYGTGSQITATGTRITNAGEGANGGNAPLGADAERGGKIDLTDGSVTMTGADRAYALRSMSGGTIETHGVDISTSGANSHAVQTYADDTTQGLSLIDVNGGTISTQGPNSYGLYAQNDGAQTNGLGVVVTTNGEFSIGVEAVNGGRVTTADGATVTTTGDLAPGIDASGSDAETGAPSTVSATQTTVLTTGANSPGVTANGPGTDVRFAGGNITTQGKASPGALATAGGAIELTDTNIDVSFPNDNPVQPIDPAGLYATGAGSRITAADTRLTMASSGLGSGDPAIGVKADQGAAVSLTGGQVDMTGDTRAYGVQAAGGNSGITVQDSSVSTAGTSSFGVYAYAGESSDPPTILGPASVSVSGGSITTLGDDAYALLAVNDGATVSADHVNVATGRTDGSTGAGAFGAEALGGGAIAINGGTITTNGAGASGLDASSADSVTGRLSSLTATAVAVTASGAGSSAASVSDGGSMSVTDSILTSNKGDGITITNNGSVTLDGTAVNAPNGASIVSNVGDAGVRQDIVVGNGSTLTQNDGALLKVNRTDAGMDGIVNLTLKAGSTSTGDIEDSDGLAADGTRAGGGKTNFTVEDGASWSGNADGLQDATVGDGGSFVHNGGGAIAGNVTAGNSTAVSFNDAAVIGGSVTTGSNSTMAFNQAATIGGDVETDANTSVAFGGAATVGGDVAAGPGSAITFAGPANIGNDVQGNGTQISFVKDASIGHDVRATGGTVAFAGAATIGNDLSADAAAISFSKTDATSINGNLVLDNGATTHGGTAGTASQITVAGDATVNDGATLGGNMIIKGALHGSGGNLSPGNSVGRLVVGSIAGFTGAYNAEVNASGQSDRIVVQSNADLSGIDLHVGQENGTGGVRLNQSYTVVETTNGATVQNTFRSAGLDSSFDNTLLGLAAVQYGPTDVEVSIGVDPDKMAAVRPMLTRNENAALSGAASIAGPNALADALFTTATNPASFDQISGESYASTRGALINDARYIRDAADERLRSAFSIAAAPGIGAMTFGADGKPQRATAHSRGVAVWTKGFGSWGHADGQGGSASLSDSTGGVMVGADGLVTDRTRAGVMFGYSHSSFDVDGRSSSADSDNYHLGVYGGSQFGNIGIRAGAAYTWSDVSASRSVNVANFADHTRSAYSGDTAQAFAELGYQLYVGRVGIEPFGNIAYVNLHTDAFNESGGDAALHGNAESTNNLFSTLGVHGSTDFSIGHADLTATGTLGWQHTYGQVTPTTTLAFNGGQAFSVVGAPIARDAAVAAVGVNAKVGRSTILGVSYSGQLAAHAENHGFTANLNYRF